MDGTSNLAATFTLAAFLDSRLLWGSAALLKGLASMLSVSEFFRVDDFYSFFSGNPFPESFLLDCQLLSFRFLMPAWSSSKAKLAFLLNL